MLFLQNIYPFCQNLYFFQNLGSLEKKEKLLASNAIASICSTSLMSNDEELLKTVTKCLAKFTNHGCDHFVALQIQVLCTQKILNEITKSFDNTYTGLKCMLQRL